VSEDHCFVPAKSQLPVPHRTELSRSITTTRTPMRRPTKSSTFGRMPRSARVAGDKEKPSIAIARLLQRPLQIGSSKVG
jgi:hypothetical protein